MVYSKFVAFYNAYIAEETKPLVVFGWTMETGWDAVLSEKENQYELVFKEVSDVHLEVKTPFITSIQMNDPPKSINVKDIHDDYQVQVYGFPTAGSGGNKAGTWIRSE